MVADRNVYGIMEVARMCKCKTEVYSRVVGYYRPIQQWNKGKKAEYFNRKPYKFNLSAFQEPKPQVQTVVEECSEAL